jgi:hypothetical protein
MSKTFWKKTSHSLYGTLDGRTGSTANKACPSSRYLFSHVIFAMLITKRCPVTFVFLERDV